MSKKKITILTEPIGNVRNFSRLLVKRIVKKNNFWGHSAVTRSLVTGLNQIDEIEVNYNPFFEYELAEHVHVLAGVKTLYYAIGLKEKGKIKRLTAGPNVVVFSDDFDGIIGNPAIDIYLQPSKWAANMHMDMEPRLAGRCFPWPAGVDISAFIPDEKYKESNKVLVYHKDESDQFCFRVMNLLLKEGFCPIRIKYGKYNLDEYKQLLNQCAFAVVISRQESQGLYLAEAWAMNTPTFCFDPHYYFWDYSNRKVSREGDIFTAPYLTADTGFEWETLEELKILLVKYKNGEYEFKPREWVEKNMTDIVCAQRFLEIVGVFQ